MGVGGSPWRCNSGGNCTVDSTSLSQPDKSQPPPVPSHRRHRVNLLRRSSAGATVLADDAVPATPTRSIMAGWIHPAMIGPAVGWNTPRAHSSMCRKSAGSGPKLTRIAVVTRSNVHGVAISGVFSTVRFTTECPGPGRAANARLWAAYIMFKVTMTTGGAATCWWWPERPRWACGPRCRGPGRRGVYFGADLARIGLRGGRFRTTGGLAVVAGRSRIGRWGGTAQQQPVGLVGDKRSAMS